MNKYIRWIDKIKLIILVIFSSIIAFLILEFSYRFFLKQKSQNNFSQPTKLYQVGENFLNRDSFFKYFPNKSIRTLGLYSKPKPKTVEDITIEYDYVIETNNAGLVMKNELNYKDKVVLIIGDSFTEGSGATPWFYQLENDFYHSQLKLVNLGILGTGPVQWEKLLSSITKEFKLRVDTAVINIIPGDMIRRLWNFNDRELRCLSKGNCDYNFGIQGYNFHDISDYDLIKLNLLKSLSKDKKENFSNPDDDYVTRVKKYLKKSRIILDIYVFLMNKIPSKSETVKMNENALISIRDLAKGNFIVNVVSSKEINSTNFSKVKFARQLVKFLELNNINYSWCDIPIGKFLKHDPHPNADGYKILKKCNKSALDKVIQ
jgi:hypothetical protein